MLFDFRFTDIEETALFKQSVVSLFCSNLWWDTNDKMIIELITMLTQQLTLLIKHLNGI